MVGLSQANLADLTSGKAERTQGTTGKSCL
jgi:hypothetical protein